VAAMTQDLHWLEPVTPLDNFDEGARARVADPLWLLARQWRLGEHQGEDASSPLAAFSRVTHAPIAYDATRPDLDPTVVPAEAIVESEPGDWWTIGRRVRIGRAVAQLPAAADPEIAKLRLGALPPPYERLAGELDGRKVFESGKLAGNAIFDEVPADLADRWQAASLSYEAQFTSGATSIDVTEHEGGDLDWYSADGAGPPGAAPADERVVLTTRLNYPGAPAPRWWQLEDHHVDIGGFSPDRSHLGSILLLDVVLAHSDDWYWFPVPPPAPDPADPGTPEPPSSGVVATLHAVRVFDSFDASWDLHVPVGWSLFRTRGLDPRSLVVWPKAVAPHTGPVLDEVLLGIDEDANLAWGIELRAEGLHLNDDATSAAALLQTTRTGSRSFRYLPSSTLPPQWHPYRRTEHDRVTGEWEQGLVADLTQAQPIPRAGPTSRLIGGQSGDKFGKGHVLTQRALPSGGVRLVRRARLARDTGGRPILWIERSATPLAGPSSSHLRFDVLAEDPLP